MARNGWKEGGWSSSHGSKRQSNQLWESDRPPLWQDRVGADSRDRLYHDRVHRAETGTTRHYGRNVSAERPSAAGLPVTAQSAGLWLWRRPIKHRPSDERALDRRFHIGVKKKIS